MRLLAMPSNQECVAQLRERIVPQLRRDLASLTNGTRHIYAGAGDRPIEDITQRHIAMLKGAIASCERELAALENKSS